MMDRSPRFLPTNSGFRHRIQTFNWLLQRCPLVGASGSLLEAHLMARGKLCIGVQNVLRTCISSDEVCSLVSSENHSCLLLLVDFIAPDHCDNLVGRLRRLPNSAVNVLLVRPRSLI